MRVNRTLKHFLLLIIIFGALFIVRATTVMASSVVEVYNCVNCTLESYWEPDSPFIAIVNITPDPGYVITSFDCNGETVCQRLTDYSYRVSNSASTNLFIICEPYYNISNPPVIGGSVVLSDSGGIAQTIVTGQVIPNSGYKLNGINSNAQLIWIDDTHFKFFLYDNTTINAQFEAIKYNVNTNGDSNVSISADKSTAANGETVTISINPKNGYQLNTLTGASFYRINDTTYSFVMGNGNANIYATSKPNDSKPPIITDDTTHSITVNASEGGSAIVSANTAKEGDTITLNVKPAPGYKFVSITGVEYQSVDTENYTFVVGKEDITIDVVFEKLPIDENRPFTISLALGIFNGTVRLSQSSGVAGDVIYVYITPHGGFTLNEVTGADFTKIDDSTYSFVLAGDTVVNATFSRQESAIKVVVVSVAVASSGLGCASVVFRIKRFF